MPDPVEEAELVLAEAAVDIKFRAAFAALTELYRDERVEEYTAGGVEDLAIELAAAFGFSVDHMGELHPTPSCSGGVD